jgi:DNA-binding IclR family transcriptional regulator
MTLQQAEQPGQKAQGDGTVGKALEVLDRVAAYGRPVRFAEVLEDSPYPKATLYRLIQTLTSQRMLSFDAERGTYRPGLRLVRMAHSAWQQSSLAPIARNHLDRLSSEVGETVHLAQLDGGSVLYVDKRNAAMPVEMYSAAGKIGPAYCTGVGKAILAWLPEDELAPVLAQQSWHRFTPATVASPEAMRTEIAEIREAGFAMDREEHEPGIVCIAMPVLSPGGRVHGAVSVTGPTHRVSLTSLMTLAPALRQATDAIARDLRDWRFPDQQEG